MTPAVAANIRENGIQVLLLPGPHARLGRLRAEFLAADREHDIYKRHVTYSEAVGRLIDEHEQRPELLAELERLRARVAELEGRGEGQ